MRQRYDLLAMSMLALAAVLSVWLGVWGPTNTTTLVMWQPTIAAIVALTAAGLAYYGAMAKVREDREKERRELQRKQLGLYLRLRFACQALKAETNNALVPLERGRVKLDPIHIRLTSRPEFDEMWANLDMMPIPVSIELDRIRTIIPQSIRLIETFPAGQAIELPALGPSYDSPLHHYRDMCRTIDTSATRIVATLGVAIAKMWIK